MALFRRVAISSSLRTIITMVISAMILSSCSSPDVQITGADTSHTSKEQKSLEKIVQIVIDLPTLQQYYHADTIADRKPLIITGKPLPNNLNLKKFGTSVRVLSKKQIKQEKLNAYLEFTKTTIKGNSAEVLVSYAVEGVSAKVKLAKQHRTWKVTHLHIGEH